jgi:2-oxopent-4-enoate/cis-2-oxohex-4-enoate hydratase
MLDKAIIETVGQALFQCLQDRTVMAPLTETYADIDINDAYQISQVLLALRLDAGETVIGKKIGATSLAVQEMLGVFQPDFGFLTDAMWARDGMISTDRLIAPRAEAEIGFRLHKSLQGPGITGQDVLEATESVVACFEIVDSRIRDWKIKIEDTVADNASCGVFVLSEEAISPSGLDLSSMKVIVEKNGQFLSEGLGSAVQGAPENAIAWLANTLGEFGIPFNAGEIVLSGSLVPLEPAVAGDHFRMTIDGLGQCEAHFL